MPNVVARRPRGATGPALLVRADGDRLNETISKCVLAYPVRSAQRLSSPGFYPHGGLNINRPADRVTTQRLLPSPSPTSRQYQRPVRPADCCPNSMSGNASDPGAGAQALNNINHIVAGVYIWEFVLTVDYEYRVMTGKRKFTSTFPLYLGCRWFALLSILVQLHFPPGLDCQTFVVGVFAFAYLSFLFASALILLRVYALWERSRIIIAYDSNTSCIIENSLHNRTSVFSTFITDLVLLVLMLVGVLRWKDARRTSGIWLLLYTQGIAWVMVFALAEVPPLIFIALNLSDALNLLPLVPGLAAVSIGASRMYRGLVDGASSQFCCPPVIDIKERSAGTRTQFPGPSLAQISRPVYVAERADDAAGEVLISSNLNRKDDMA
ncbi:hypothetical protein BC827DRAFT_42482 [Russula dissimulans]|nr:hypothetical protein BC827DRAFT_42482 [Russula dissimulans]